MLSRFDAFFLLQDEPKKQPDVALKNGSKKDSSSDDISDEVSATVCGIMVAYQLCITVVDFEFGGIYIHTWGLHFYFGY